MDYDTYGEVINGERTYQWLANDLKEGRAVLIGWTDQNSTHFDILLKLGVQKYGDNFQGGIRGSDLFVSVMRRGAFGFNPDHTDTHPGYYDEKLGGGMGITGEKLAELINGIKGKL